ncbi:MAG: hypothetical protein AAF479_01855 [Pseudomonadota bacterium]
MPAIVVQTIGPDGAFATLADWANALPSDLTATDEVRVAELGTAAVDPGGVVISCACDSTRYVVVRAQAGATVSDLSDPELDPLRIEAGQGALVYSTSGAAISLSGSSVIAEVHGLQILADFGTALTDGGAGSRFSRITRCALDASSTIPAVTVAGVGSEIGSSIVIQRGSGDGIALRDGASSQGCTVFKPARANADGVGVSTAGSPVPSASSIAVSGFLQNFGDDFSQARNLASDQMNLLPAPDDLSDASWTRISASIDPGDTIVGPTGVPLQKVGNNLNAFSYFSAGVLHTLQPGERFSFSIVVSDVTALISALLFDAVPNKPEMRVDWQGSTPVIGILGATASLQTVSGTVTDLGGGAWRLELTAENTTASPLDVTPIFYVTRDVANVGLDVGMYAGSAMAGNGHLGSGFAYPSSVPGIDPIHGFDPAMVFHEDDPALLDLRPVQGSVLETSSATVVQGADYYRRIRTSPETIGAVSLSTVLPAAPAGLAVASSVDPVHALDEAEVLSAFRSRTMLPATPVRVINI